MKKTATGSEFLVYFGGANADLAHRHSEKQRRLHIATALKRTAARRRILRQRRQCNGDRDGDGHGHGDADGHGQGDGHGDGHHQFAKQKSFGLELRHNRKSGDEHVNNCSVNMLRQRYGDGGGDEPQQYRALLGKIDLEKLNASHERETRAHHELENHLDLGAKQQMILATILQQTNQVVEIQETSPLRMPSPSPSLSLSPSSSQLPSPIPSPPDDGDAYEDDFESEINEYSSSEFEDLDLKKKFGQRGDADGDGEHPSMEDNDENRGFQQVAHNDSSSYPSKKYLTSSLEISDAALCRRIRQLPLNRQILVQDIIALLEREQRQDDFTEFRQYVEDLLKQA